MTKPQEEILKGFYKLLSIEFNRLTTVVENTTPEQDEFAGKAATLLEAADIHFPYLKHIQDYAQEMKPVNHFSATKQNSFDYGVIQTCKTQLHSADKPLFDKMRSLVNDKNPKALGGMSGLSETEKEYVLDGAALMYQLINNPEFLKAEAPAPEPFKKFWVVSVNNYLCDAAYSGKELKERVKMPSFRKFYFIKSWDDLKGFTKREEISNEDLVKKALASEEKPAI